MVAENEPGAGRLAGAGATVTLRPMRDPLTRWTPRTRESRSTIENSISLSSIRQPSETDVYGPM